MKYLVFMAVMAILCYKEKKVCGFVGRWKEQHRSCQEDAGLSPQVMFHIGYTLGLLPLIDLIPWVLNLRVSTMITKLFSFLHKQSPWKKIIVCFEYLLVASVLLAISPLVRSELQGNQKPIVLVDSDSDNNGRVTQSNRDPVRCDLRLMLVDTADSLVNKGRNLVIVALVGNNLHIRIFDANGKKLLIRQRTS